MQNVDSDEWDDVMGLDARGRGRELRRMEAIRNEFAVLGGPPRRRRDRGPVT
jgi:hypothetical protein